MKKRINQGLWLGMLFFCAELSAQTTWSIANSRIQSRWAATVDPRKTLPEYPRPQMVRDQWQNLNGLWKYAITASSQQQPPAAYRGEILVPFALESALSGVNQQLTKDSLLWYSRNISIPAQKNKDLLLHFGAVDWNCIVFVNGKEVGRHRGGYDPFAFNISNALRKGSSQEIVVRVADPTDDGPQPRGKQVNKPEGIWYTPVSGIWQTVWLEQVPKTYITSTKQIPNVDNNTINISAAVENSRAGDQLKIRVMEGRQELATHTVDANATASLVINQPKLWTPSSPFLYDLTINLIRNGKTIDEVKSYFAMRKISMKADQNGIQRMLLNNKFLFQYGPLDQGWWPDGLYTAPSDEALKFDIEQTKAMGFNMIRKHVKVEPARWYFHCDKIGMLVWQDMPSGDLGNVWDPRPGVYGKGTEQERSDKSESIFREEWKEIMNDLYNFPSIVVWVPFNEAWGQFKTKEIVEWTMKADSSRLVNHASGGNFYEVGHIIDLHNYPEPAMPRPDLFGTRQLLVLGEFGGLGLPIDGHTWQTKNNWGYQTFKNKEELFSKYSEFIDRIPQLIEKGLSAAVYTQTTDVEVETNGLMTYDREIIKMPMDKLKELHQKLYR